jgi:hypothetical protein
MKKWYDIIKAKKTIERTKEQKATIKAFKLLEETIDNSDRVDIIHTPELDLSSGEVRGTVEITGDSGMTYQYDFGSNPTFERDINIDQDEFMTLLDQYVVMSVEDTVQAEICVRPRGISGDSALPQGDYFTSMIMGLLNDDNTRHRIESLNRAMDDESGKELFHWDSFINDLQGWINANLDDYIGHDYCYEG